VKRGPTTKSNRAQFGWLAGEATPAAALGDPVTGPTSYALCLYDERSPGGTLILEADTPHVRDCDGQPCWRWLPGASGELKRARYLDSDQFPDGVRSMSLKSGVAGKTMMRLKAGGLKLPVLPSQPLVPPVTAVILNSLGCWGATYDGLAVQKNDGFLFKGKTTAP
jgi:hypothetical protein